MHSVNFIDILKSYVWHVSVQAYRLHGAKMPDSHPVANDKVLFKASSVCSRSFVEVDYVQKVKLVHV
jgi:hypothetical protein